MLRLTNFLALLCAQFIAIESSISTSLGREKVACSALKLRYPQNTFLHNTPGYAYETQLRKTSVGNADLWLTCT
jgi:hypothetical protein